MLYFFNSFIRFVSLHHAGKQNLHASSRLLNLVEASIKSILWNAGPIAAPAAFSLQ